MATLILTAVGTALGGPIGGALGALAGQAIDNAVLFKPKGREGARLSDLRVQTSTYGSQVPALFGTMRVAGTVIWASDINETRGKTGGGKGQPKVTTYSYSASFAVALSCRAVRSVGRIWADGNLLRGAAGDFKTGLGAFRLYNGDEDQAVDPLIAAAQGMMDAPAHRGIAYALFEELQLADYGNRIPSLTFEVEADAGAVGVDVVARWVSGGAVSADAGILLGGFAASGADAGEALSPLMQPLGLRLRSDGPLRLVTGVEGAAALDLSDPLRAANGRDVQPMRHIRAPAASVPGALSVRHHDPARDYQAGVQRAERAGGAGGERRIELPVALAAADARGIAAGALAAAWRGRTGLEAQAGWRALLLQPGTVVSVVGEAGLWIVETREWEGMAVRLMLRRAAGVGGAQAASAGDAVGAPDQLIGATSLMVVDLPAPGDAVAVGPLLYVAAAGEGGGWRSAALFRRIAGSDALEPMGTTALPAVMGSVTAAPGAGPREMIDTVSVIAVALLNADMMLADCDDARLARGANLALVGGELVQFGRAMPLGGGAWRLSRLLRGRRGTERAMGTHTTGESFLLIEADALFPVPDAAAAGAGEMTVAAIGIADPLPAEASVSVTGEAMRPPAPVHGRWEDDGAGGHVLRWIRRSRAGWYWRDGVDAPLGEERELYRIALMDGDMLVRSAECDGPAWHYDAAMRSADADAGHVFPAMTVQVRQVGSAAQGRALVVNGVA